MRSSLILAGLVFLSGCGGSKSDKPVKLSIDNPKKTESTSGSNSQQPADVETPENARKLLVHAAKLAKQGLVGKAIEQLSHAISMNPEDPELYIARAEVYGMMREDANALADYSTAVRVRPKDASIHNRRGFFLLSRNEHTRALKEFSAAIELNSKSPQAFNNRGLVYLSISQPEKAIADFGQAVKLDPKYADAWNNRGFANYKMKKFEAALVDLGKAIEAKPGYVNALNNRGLVHLAMDNHTAAVKDMSSAIESAPYEIKLYQARRSALLELQRFEEAQRDGSRIQWLFSLAALTKKIDQEPLVHYHYMHRGDYLAGGDELAAAIRDYSKAAQLNNTAPEPLIQRAICLLALGEPDKAIRDCATAIEMGDPKQAYSVRGDAYLAQGKYTKAIEDFEVAQRFDTAVADAYLHRAKAFAEAGKSEEAKRDRQQAAAIDPERKLQ